MTDVERGLELELAPATVRHCPRLLQVGADVVPDGSESENDDIEEKQAHLHVHRRPVAKYGKQERMSHRSFAQIGFHEGTHCIQQSQKMTVRLED